jgi:signal transduction histidine kinase
MVLTEFGDLIAERMRAEHQMLAARWFERLVELLPVDAREVFPTESLLDHIPALIVEISAYLRQPEADAIAANTAILEKARELGALRHAQQASLHQLLREYHVLNGVLVTFVLEEMDRLGVAPAPSAGVILVARLHQAVDVLAQSTVESFVALYAQTITDQRERLEQFTRMAAHEWRQPLGALQFGVKLLKVESLDQARTHRTLEIVERNVDQLVALTQKLEMVARISDAGDNLLDQEVSVATVANEAARQLREMADARSVEIRVSDTLPTVTVDVGRLELTLVNLLSNGIKYSDATKPERYVEITGVDSGDDLCRITVSDNGVGIPAASLKTIFHRFTRAHEDRDELKYVGGMGLGLSIVEDSVQAMQGHIEVASTEGVGTTFVLTLPMTRRDAR